MTKEIKEVKPSEVLKKIFITIGEQSDIGKTYIINGLTYSYEADGVKVAKFDGDFSNSNDKSKGFYTQYSIAGNNNPFESCVGFDLNKDKEVVAYATDTNAPVVAIDLPVKAATLIQEMYGSDNIEMFYNSFYSNGYELNLLVPIAGEKDIDNTLKLLASTLKDISLDSKINIIIVLNLGLMNSRGVIGDVAKYEAFMEKTVFNPNVNVIEVRIKTMFDNKGVIAGQLQQNKFETFFNTKQNGFIAPLVSGIRNDMKKIYEAVK